MQSKQLSLFKTPIAEGVFKGVYWKSMSYVEPIRARQIEELWDFSKTIRLDGAHDDIVKFALKTSVYEFLTTPLTKTERMNRYKKTALYNNNYRL